MMKKFLTPFLLLFVLLSGCSNGQQNTSIQNSDKPIVENVDTKTFQELIAKNPEGVVLDVRTPEEVANGHLANASTINFYDEDFQKKVSMIRKDQPVLVYCAAGSRSAKAAEQMSQMGFTKIYNLQGGYNGWMNVQAQLVNAKVLDNKNGMIYFLMVTDKQKMKGADSEKYNQVMQNMNSLIASIKITE